jgi:hypothetical protein
MPENTEDKGFKVRDRRKIFEDTVKEAEKTPDEGENTKKTQAEAPQQDESTNLPELNFSTFILSLSTSTLMHLGELPNPETNQLEKNLPLAKQTIDLIDMMKQKTAGNLDQDEDQLITNLLYDLKLKYVAATKKG